MPKLNRFYQPGFKCEWMTVKDKMLWIGSTGKEQTTKAGEFESHDPEWIKIVDRLGVVKHVNWTGNYLALKTKSGYGPPGSIIFLNFLSIIIAIATISIP